MTEVAHLRVCFDAAVRVVYSQVDIYAFGMCMLEMITKERPYSECNNAAQVSLTALTLVF
jgi:serine/threonine protein kinase